MKDKKIITEDNYKEVVLKRAIIACWILLIVCFAVKIFGGNYFAIVCNSQGFINVCEFIERTFIKYIIGYLLFIMSSYMLLVIADGGHKFKSIKTVLYLIVCSLIWLFQFSFAMGFINIQMWLYDIIDFALLYFMLVIFSKKFTKPILCVLLLFIFTLISTITKNIGYNVILTETPLVMYIYLIDYYILLILSSLYSKKIYLRRNK